MVDQQKKQCEGKKRSGNACSGHRMPECVYCFWHSWIARDDREELEELEDAWQDTGGEEG